MNVPLPALARQSARQGSASSRSGAAAQPARSGAGLMRRYDVTSLNAEGALQSGHHIAPATPLFEMAFSALARGSVIATPDGPVAIEDLLPGDLVETQEGDSLPVQWIGATTLVPQAAGQSPAMTRLTRIMADSFGIARPQADLVAGPAARLLRDDAGLRMRCGDGRVLLPAADFADGQTAIILTPPSPVRVYHLALTRHAVIRANGLEIESYHPGRRALDDLGRNMAALFLSLFPHVTDLSGFGTLLHPRTTRAALDALHAA